MGEITTVGGIETFQPRPSGLDTDPALKHCPFCGSIAAVRVAERSHWWTKTPREWPFSIECANGSCGVMTPQHYSTRELAIAAWNRRASEGKDGGITGNPP